MTSRTRVLVFGERGQLGQELLAANPSGSHVLGSDGTDITNATTVREAIQNHRPDAVVNCAAFTGVDDAEVDTERAYAVNRDGAGIVANACAEAGVHVVQVSTDFVFDGTQSTPYEPRTETHAIGVYGKSKAEGEAAVTAAGPAAIVRTSWVYSTYRSNFVKTMLNLMRAGRDLNVVDDQRGAPTWTRDLAAALLAVAERGRTGVGHWSDAGSCTWYEFAVAIQNSALAVGSVERPVSISPVTTADYAELIGKELAPRPAYSVLDSTSLALAIDRRPRSWEVCLSEMIEEERSA